MSRRTVTAVLKAEVNQYIAGMGKAKAATDAVDESVRKTGRSTKEQEAPHRSFAQTVQKSARENEQAWRTVGTALTTAGVAMGAGVTAAVATYARFDEAMSSVQAATHESTENMHLLREAAIEAGADTAFSATEAAGGIEELAKAGVSTADILGGGLTGALNLAAAGGIGVSEAAETAASAMTQFKLEGRDVTHIADLLAAGAGKAQGGVTDMAQALNQAGLVSSQMGLSIEETVGTLTSFASAGMVGSDAGTSLRTMLLRLANPTKENTGLMEELGLAAYDAQGNFVGMEALAGQLQDRLAGLTQEQRNAALAQIFGQDAIRAASILYEEGAEGVAEWTAAVNDSGYAAETAELRMDNLRGDIERLGGSVETLFIRMGEAGDGPVRSFVQLLDGLADAASSLPGPVLGAVTGVLALGAGVSTGAGLLALGLPKYVEFKDSLKVLGDTSPRVASGIGMVTGTVGRLAMFGGALGVTAVGLGAVAAALKDNAEVRGLDDIADSIQRIVMYGQDASNLYIGDIFAEMPTFLGQTTIEARNLEEAIDKVLNPGAGDTLSALFGRAGLPSYMEDYNQLLMQADETLVQMLERGGDEGAAAREFIDGMRLSAEQLTEVLPGASNALGVVSEDAQAAGDAAAGAAGGADALAQGMDGVEGSSEEAAKALEEWYEMVSKADAEFINLLGAFEEVIATEKKLAEETAAATASTTDSWEDFYDGHAFSMDQYLANLEKQVAAQTEWEQNMLLLSGRASQGVIDELAAMGAEGAPLVAALVNASDEELARLETAFGERSGTATTAFAAALEGAAPVIAAASGQLTDEALAEMVNRLASGEITLQEAIDSYDLMVQLDADASAAESVIDQTAASADNATGTIDIAADSTPARAVLNGAIVDVDASTGTFDIDGNPKPSIETLDSVLRTVGLSSEDITIDGNPMTANMTLGQLMARVRESEGQVKIGGNNATGATALQNLVNTIARSYGYVQVRADTSSAAATLDRFIGTYNGRRITTYQETVIMGQGRAATGGDVSGIANAARYLAGGGAVNGPGTGTSDSVPAMGPHGVRFWLSNGEHVWTDEETRAVGGHGAMYALRLMARRGELTGIGRRDGGPTSSLRMPTQPTPYFYPEQRATSSGAATLAPEDRSLIRDFLNRSEQLVNRPVELRANGRNLASVVNQSQTYSSNRGGRSGA